MSHSNEFWNFGNKSRSETNPKGFFKPLFPHNLGRPLHHPEQDYNAHLISQIVKGFRVIGSGSDGQMITSDLELGIKLHEVAPSDADYAHYIQAGAKDEEWIWVPAEMGGITTSPLSVTGNATDKNDCTGQLATINAVSTGGTPQYEFSIQASSGISFGNISNWSTSNVFTQVNGAPLSIGTPYYIYCKDQAGGNVISSSVTVSEIISHNVTISVTQQVSQPGGNDGGLEVITTGGVGSYTYVLYQGNNPSNLQPSNVIETIASTTNATETFPTGTNGILIGAGQYFVIVTDNTTQCVVSSNVVQITEPAGLTSTPVPMNADCIGGTHDLSFINSSGGTPSYSYSITNPATTGYTWQSSSSFTGIPSGDTLVYARIMDSTSFIADLGDYQFQDPLDYTFSVSSVDANCQGIAGSILFNNLLGGPTITSYNWTGDLYWQFSIDNGVTWTSNYNSTLNGSTYTYSGVTSSSTPYQCRVRRVSLTAGNACPSTMIETIVNQAPLVTATVVAVDNDSVCGTGGNGTIDISSVLIGGQNSSLEYDVEWTDNNTSNVVGNISLTQDNYIITGLNSSAYTVTLQDTSSSGGGCLLSTVINIGQSGSTLFLSSTPYNSTCNGSNDGYVDYTIVNGLAPYTVESFDENGVVTPHGTTSNPNGNIQLAIGINYKLKITDSLDCFVETALFDISEPAEVVAVISVNSNAGCDNASGELTGSATGGSGNYTYEWRTGGNIIATTANISSLSAGVYELSVFDDTGCPANPISITVTSFNAMTVTLANVANVLCNGNSDGTASVIVTGDSPFTYAWTSSTSSYTNTIQSPNDLIAGSYNVVVTDVNGCIHDPSGLDLTINEPSSLGFGINSTDESYPDANDGQAIVTISGGTLEYTVVDSNSGSTQTGTSGQTVFTFTGLSDQTANITVTDSNGCSFTDNYTIGTGGSQINSSGTSTVIECNGGTSDVTLTTSGGSGNYQYAITEESTSTNTSGWGTSTTSTSNVWNNVSAGSWYFLVKDVDTGNQTNEYLTITQPTIPTISWPTNSPESFVGANDAVLIISITGGNGAYTVTCVETGEVATFSNGQTHTFTSIISAGTYSFTGEDANGTSTPCPITIVNQIIAQSGTPLSLTGYTTPSGVLCYGDSDGQICITATGGSGTYEYNIDNGSWQNNNCFSNLSAGSYDIFVRDANNVGIIDSGNATVQTSEEIIIISEILTDGTCTSDPSYYIKWSGANNPTSGYAHANEILLTWTIGNNGTYTGSQTYTANSLGNNEYDLTLALNTISQADEEGFFIPKITSDSCEKYPGPKQYSTSAEVTMTIIQVSEPECSTDDWIYNISAAGGDTQVYTLENFGVGTLATSWDGSSQDFAIPQSSATSSIRLYHEDFVNNGCYDSATITTNNVTALQFTGASINNPDCYGSGNGSTMSFTIIGGNSNANLNEYKYIVSNDGGLNYGPENNYTGPVTNEAIGNGSVQVEAYRIVNNNSTLNSCFATIQMGIGVNPVAINGSASATTQPADCNPGSNYGEITMIVSGGTGTYLFSKNGGSTYTSITANSGGNYVYTNLAPGTYSIMVKDDNDCPAFSQTLVISAASSPSVANNVHTGCWRFSDTAAVQLEITMTDGAKQANGDYQFNDGSTTNTTGIFTYSSSNMTTHTQADVTVTEIATNCQTVINNWNYTSVPSITSTGAIINYDNGPTPGDVNDFAVSNISGGYGSPYTIELYNTGGVLIHTINNHFNGTARQNNLDSGDYTYKIYDSLMGSTGCGRTYTTPMTATTASVNERTIYYFHGGQTAFPYASSYLTNSSCTYYTPTIQGGSATLSDAMTEVIDNGGTDPYNGGAGVYSVDSFDMPAGQTIISDGTGSYTQWTFAANGNAEYNYLAIPNNSDFPEDLRSASPQYLKYNGLPTNATSERKAFTYNSENYWLYRMGNGSVTGSSNFGFNN